MQQLHRQYCWVTIYDIIDSVYQVKYTTFTFVQYVYYVVTQTFNSKQNQVGFMKTAICKFFKVTSQTWLSDK